MLDASRVVDVVVEPAERRRRAAFERDEPRAAGDAARSSTAQRQGAAAAAVRGGARQPARRSTGRARRCPSRRSSAAASIDVPLEELVPFIDWTFFFAAWELKGRFPAILEHPRIRQGGARALRQRAGAARSDRRREAADRDGVYGFWPAASEDDDIVVYRDREHTRRARAVQPAAAAGGDRRRQAQPVARRLRRAARRAGRRPHRLHRRVRGHRRHRRRRAGATVRARARRLQRDPRQGAGRSPGRGVRRLSAPAARGRNGASTKRRTSTTCITRRIAASGRRSAIPPAPTTARSSSCSICSARPTIGIALTENAAMTPAASVSGLYFAHPAGALLHRRPAGRGSDRRLCEAQRAVDRSGRALADAEPCVRAGALLTAIAFRDRARQFVTRSARPFVPSSAEARTTLSMCVPDELTRQSICPSVRTPS